MRYTFISASLTASLLPLAICLPIPMEDIIAENQDANQALVNQAIMLCDPFTEGHVEFAHLAPCAKARVMEETVCKTDGTSTDSLEKHAKCMCGGEFFQNKQACDRCLLGHAGMSEREYNFYDGVLARAHNELCMGAAPAAPFASIWSTLRDAATMPTTGSTALVDSLGTSTDINIKLAMPTDASDVAEETTKLEVSPFTPRQPASKSAKSSKPITYDATVVITDLATILPITRSTRGRNGLLTGVETMTRNNYTGTYSKLTLSTSPGSAPTNIRDSSAGTLRAFVVVASGVALVVAALVL